MNRSKGWLVALGGFYLVWVALTVWQDKPLDFYLYYMTAWGLRQGQNVYALTPAGWDTLAAVTGVPVYTSPYLYPPLTAILVAPLTLLPPRWAALVWGIVNAVALLVSVWLMEQVAGSRYQVAGSKFHVLRFTLPVLPVPLLLVAGLVPVLTSLYAGQVNALLLLTIVGGLWAWQRGRPGWAGAIWAVGAFLKVIPLVLIAYLGARRAWRGVASGSLALLLLTGLSLIAVGPVALGDFVVGVLLPLSTPGQFTAYPPNQSLAGMLVRLLPAAWVRPVWLIAVLTLLLITAGLLLIQAKNAQPTPETIEARLANATPRSTIPSPLSTTCLFLVTVLLVTPTTWYHLLIVLAAPFVILFAGWQAGALSRGTLILVGIAYLLVDVQGLLWHRLASWPALTSLGTYSLLILWGLLARSVASITYHGSRITYHLSRIMQRLSFILRRPSSILVLWFILLFPVLYKPWIHGADPMGYFSWLRSAVIDHDLNTSNEYDHYGFGWIAGETTTGHKANPWAVGSAVLWSPAYLLAHGLNQLLNLAGWGWPADGYSPPYVWATTLTTALLGLITLWLLYDLGRRIVSPPAALLATVVVWLASPLVFYMYSHPDMAHANDAFVNTLFFWVWYQVASNRYQVASNRYQVASSRYQVASSRYQVASSREQGASSREQGASSRYQGAGSRYQGASSREQGAGSRYQGASSRYQGAGVWLILGVVVGLAALVRTQNGLLILIPLAQLALTSNLRFKLQNYLSLGMGAFLAFSPQMIVWKVTYGNWIVFNPYQFSSGDRFDFGNLHLWEVLFSSRGAFVWCPVLLLGLIGLIALARRERRLALALGFTFLVQWVLISGWSQWSGAASFGSRFLVNCTPVFTLGLAALIEAARPRLGLRTLTVLGAAFVVWNGLLLVQYALGTVPREATFEISELVRNQFLVVPQQLGRLLRVLLTRQL